MGRTKTSRRINALHPLRHQGLGHGSNTQILLQYQRIRPILAMQKASAGVTTESGMQLWFWGKQTLPPRPSWATTLPSIPHTLSHTPPRLFLAGRQSLILFGHRCRYNHRVFKTTVRAFPKLRHHPVYWVLNNPQLITANRAPFNAHVTPRIQTEERPSWPSIGFSVWRTARGWRPVWHPVMRRQTDTPA